MNSVTHKFNEGDKVVATDVHGPREIVIDRVRIDINSESTIIQYREESEAVWSVESPQEGDHETFWHDESALYRDIETYRMSRRKSDIEECKTATKRYTERLTELQAQDVKVTTGIDPVIPGGNIYFTKTMTKDEFRNLYPQVRDK